MAADDTPIEQQLRDALLAIPEATVRGRLAEIGDKELSAWFSALDIRVNPRFISHPSRPFRVRIRGLGGQALVHLAQMLCQPLAEEAREVLGEDFDDPSPSQLRALVDHLLLNHDPAAVRSYLLFVRAIGAPAAEDIAELMQSDKRLSRPDDDAERPDRVSAGGAPRENLAEDTREYFLEVQEALFTELDQLLIRTAVATHTDTLGAPDREQLRLIVTEFIRLNADRRSSYFHVGFLDALDPDSPTPPREGFNAERRLWYRFGLISGEARRGTGKVLADIVLDDFEVALDVVGDEAMGRTITGPVLRSLLPGHPVVAAKVLSHRDKPFDNGLAISEVMYEHARQLLARGRHTEAEALFAAVERHAPYLRVGGRARSDLRRRIAACHRARNDFAGAQAVLDSIAEEDRTPAMRAILLVEQALIDGRFGHMRHVRFPTSPAEEETIRSRLAEGRELFERALEHDRHETRAAYCLGVLAYARQDWAASATLLEQADARMRDDPIFVETGLHAETLFYRGVAMLELLDPATDGPAYAAIKEGLEAGATPPPETLKRVAALLAAHESTHQGKFLRDLWERAGNVSPFVDDVVQLAIRGDDEALRLVREQGRHRELGAPQRFQMLTAAIRGEGTVGDSERVSQLAEEVDDLLANAVDEDLDREWAGILGRDPYLRAGLGSSEADAARIEALRRIGATDEALAATRALFHRANAGSISGYDPHDLYELAVELDAAEEDLAALRRALPKHREKEEDQLSVFNRRPARIIFVGGNETQARYQSALEESLVERYGDRVHVDWVFSGWSAKWVPHADAVESRYRMCDALVLMTLVRTNMGRRLRATAGDAGVPWVACTSHGRRGIERALHRAVEVAASRRR